MPPPSANRPLGADTATEFPRTVLFSSVSRLCASPRMPPPSACAVGPPPATFPLTVVSTRARVPQLSMPPPPACANAHGRLPQRARTLGTVSAGRARLPATTLLVIRTLAGRPTPRGGAISMPPPRAVARTYPRPQLGTSAPQPPVGSPVVRPPAIVTRETVTSSGRVESGGAIVRTGPPPRTTLLPAPAPTSVTLLSIVTPPRNVPRPSAIVSPSWAAATP